MNPNLTFYCSNSARFWPGSSLRTSRMTADKYSVGLARLMDSRTFDYVLGIRHFDFQIWQLLFCLLLLVLCVARLLKWNSDSVNTAAQQKANPPSYRLCSWHCSRVKGGDIFKLTTQVMNSQLWASGWPDSPKSLSSLPFMLRMTTDTMDTR